MFFPEWDTVFLSRPTPSIVKESFIKKGGICPTWISFPLSSRWMGAMRNSEEFAPLPIILYQLGVNYTKPEGKDQRGYLREPLKRQATKSPGRPGRPFRRSITKYRTNCRQSRSTQFS